jgi:hypothetical protein
LFFSVVYLAPNIELFRESTMQCFREGEFHTRGKVEGARSWRCKAQWRNDMHIWDYGRWEVEWEVEGQKAQAHCAIQYWYEKRYLTLLGSD